MMLAGQKQTTIFCMPRHRLRAAILLGTALSGSYVWEATAQAQTLCSSSMTSSVASCTNSNATTYASGLTVGSGVTIGTLTNTGTGVIGGSSTITGIYNDGIVTVLDNETGGIIEAQGNGNSNAIWNRNNIGTLNNNGTIESITTGNNNSNGIFSDTTIGTLTNNGIIESTITGAGTGISNGIFNTGNISALTNNGTISATDPTFSYGAFNSGKINTFTNNGIIEGIGSGNGYSYGLDNAGTMTTLINTGTIESISTASGYDFAIVDSGFTGTIINSGTITGKNSALYIAAGSQAENLANSGIILGDIENKTNNAVTISGGTGAGFGTLAGYNNTTGLINSPNANINFSSGNLVLNDNTVAKAVNNNGATLALGENTPKIISITGNYTQASTGTLEVDISPSQGTAQPVAGIDYSQLNVIGTASLAGNLLVNVVQGHCVVGSKYDVIQTTSGVSGPLNTQLAGAYSKYLNISSQISGNNYEITITGFNSHGGGTGQGSTPGLAFTSGRIYGASLFAQISSLFATLSSVDGTGAGYWMHGLGSFGHAPQINYSYKGFVSGRGFAVSQHLIVGGAISNVYTNTSESDSSSVTGNNIGALVYSIYSLPKLVLTSVATGGYFSNRARRYLTGIGSGKLTTSGVYGGASFHADYALLKRGHLFVIPYAVASYLYTTAGGRQEVGLDGAINMNLHYGRVSSSLAQVGSGLTTGYKTFTPYGALTSWISLGGTGTLGNTHTRVAETLGLETAGVSAQIASKAAFSPAAGVVLAGQSTAWKLSTNWSGQFAKRTNGQAFTLNGSYPL